MLTPREGSHDPNVRSRSQPKPRTPWYSGLRNSFLTGIVVIAPVGTTVWLIWTVIGWVDGFVLPFVPDSYQPEALIKRVLGPETG